MQSGKKYTILIIEDEQMVVSTLKGRLKASGFNVLVAENGSSGLKIAQESHPDLILLDIVLPVMDGITFLENLRKDDWGRKVPVIILSNLSKAETIAESKEKGVNTYLVKTDWKLKEVIQKVKYELGIL